MNQKRNSENNDNLNLQKKGRRKPARILLLICAFLLIAVLGVGALFARSLLSDARTVKADLRDVVASLQRQDPDGTVEATEKLERDAAELDRLLRSPLISIAGKLPAARDEIAAARALSALLNDTTESLLKPAVSFLRDHPLSELKGESGNINVETVGAYIAFALEKSDALSRFAETVESVNALPFGKLESRFPELKDELELARRAALLSVDATQSFLKPSLDFVMSHPLSSLKTEDGGMDLALINDYIGFLDASGPQMERLSEEIRNFDLGPFAGGETAERAREKLEQAMRYYRKAEKLLPVVKAFLGNGEDRVYLFAAQNSSEIRASGGFPGAMGLVRIRNGEIIVEDFRPVTGMINFYGSWRTEISYQEAMLFSDWFYAPRDADFCPDFERVGPIWAIAYEEEQGERVDGVISATPAIMQRLIGVIGDVELADGSILTGDNATRVLEYDLYYKYMSSGEDTSVGNDITDALFSEAAKTVISKITGSLDEKNALKYLAVVEESAEDRTLMLWFADEEEQNAVRAAGLDAGLDRDPATPHAGIYISLNNPSRLGWFLDMEPEVTEVERHEDGSRVYSVCVKLTNTITQEELSRASGYIAGYPQGVFKGLIHLFAPAGGTISNVEATGNLYFAYDEYHDLQLAYAKNIYLNPGESATITYTVTTAPVEQEDLALSLTPTLTAYR